MRATILNQCFDMTRAESGYRLPNQRTNRPLIALRTADDPCF